MSTPTTRKELTHARIVEVAARAIRRAGYRGVGVADIMKEAGLTHGGFYAHFPSRDALVVEALQRAGSDNLAGMGAAIDRLAVRGRSRFEALVTAYLHDSALERIEDGCVIAALASESTRQDEAVRAEARQRVTAMVAMVRACLPEGSDEATAEQVTATLVGTLQLARTVGGAPGRAMLARARAALMAQQRQPAT